MDLPDTISLIIIAFMMINLFLALFVRRDAISSGMKEEGAIMWGMSVFITSLAGVLVYLLTKVLNEMLSKATGNDQAEPLRSP